MEDLGEKALGAAIVSFGEDETMSTSTSGKQSPQEMRAKDTQTLAATVQSLKKIVYLLGVIFLVTSACFNVYLLRQTIVLEARVTAYEAQRANIAETDAFFRRFVADFRHLSRTNEQVNELFLKHRDSLQILGLDSQARGFSEE